MYQRSADTFWQDLIGFRNLSFGTVGLTKEPNRRFWPGRLALKVFQVTPLSEAQRYTQDRPRGLHLRLRFFQKGQQKCCSWEWAIKHPATTTEPLINIRKWFLASDKCQLRDARCAQRASTWWSWDQSRFWWHDTWSRRVWAARCYFKMTYQYESFRTVSYAKFRKILI